MNQTILEKETLSISLGQCDLTDEIQKEIELYQKFMDKYEEIFKEILYRWFMYYFSIAILLLLTSCTALIEHKEELKPIAEDLEQIVEKEIETL